MQILKWLKRLEEASGPKKTKGQQIAVGLAMLVAMLGSAGLGAFFEFYTGTVGRIPSMQAKVIVPEVPETETTLVEVRRYLERDKTDEIEYKEGFNCYDSVLLTKRNADWEGILAIPAALIYEDGGHAILLFPTTDGGWIFVEPQEDLVIYPRVGQFYRGKKVIRIDWYEGRWVPFMEAPN